MKRKTTFFIMTTIIISIVVGGILALREVASPKLANPSKSTGLTVMQFGLYAVLTREEMIDQSEVIFLGKVMDISPTRWNQDDGTQWQDEATGFGLQLHYVEFEVIKPIVDGLDIGSQATITILGPSPLDGFAEHNLKVDDEAVVFAVQRELAWQSGSKTILRLTNAPMNSNFILKEDGVYSAEPDSPPVLLKDLLREIALRRKTLIQP